MDNRDLAFGRSQVIREPSKFTVNVDLESTSLVNMSCHGDLHNAEYQTDIPVYSIETVSLP